MALISAESLFHYTEKKEYLISILTAGFAPRYNEELTVELNDRLTLAERINVPMVCFCDTPLSLASNHMAIYGQYGIGLTKQWGIENGLNPVFYMNKENLLNRKLIESIHNVVLKSKQGLLSPKTIHDLLYLYSYLKPYQCGSTYIKGNKSYPNHSYYDEKEWRFVPSQLIQEEILDPFTKFSSEKKEEINQKLKRHAIKFRARDVNFIIIDDEQDVDDILKAINDSRLFLEDEKKYLLTTLITTERIRKNF